MRPTQPALGAGVQHRRVPGHGQCTQQIGVEDHARRSWTVAGPLTEHPQSPEQQPVLPQRRFLLDRDKTVGHLEHRLAGAVQRVVPGERIAVGMQTLHLGDNVQRAPHGELHVDMAEWFQPTPELARGAPHSSCHCPDLAVRATQHRDDTVRLTQLVGSQDNSLVAVGGHPSIVRAPAVTAPRRR